MTSVVFAPDSTRVVTGSQDGTAKVWEVASGRELLTLRGHGNWVSSVAIAPDSQRIVTGAIDGKAKVWDAINGRELLTLGGHGAAITSVAVSPDSRRIATGSEDGSAKVWDAATGQEQITLKEHTLCINAVAFSSDGGRILTGSDDWTAKVWELASGKAQLTLRGHRDCVTAVAFSPDGHRVVTGGFSNDKAVRVWDAISGKELLTLVGHGGWINSVAFSSDGGRIATTSNDGTAKVWEAATAQQVATWRVEEDAAREQLAARRREHSTPTERARAQRAPDAGAIKSWLLLAPLPYKEKSGSEALMAEQVPQEANLRPRAGERVRVGAIERTWMAVELKDYLLDFSRILGEFSESRVGYAVCYIQSETHQDGLSVRVGSNDQSAVYLNGRLIYRHDQERQWAADQDVVTGVELKAGPNVLVFKVVNEATDWQGSIRLTDAAGQPVKDLKVTLTPP